MSEDLEKRIKKLEKKVAQIEKFLQEQPHFSDMEDEDPDELDEFYDRAVMIAIQYDKVSSSLLQRKLQIGFNHAAKILEQLEENGIVGPAEGIKPREVLISKEEIKNLLEKYDREKEKEKGKEKN